MNSALEPWRWSGWAWSLRPPRVTARTGPRASVRELPYARPVGKPISMRLSRAVSSAMASPPPLPRAPVGGGEEEGGGGSTRGAPGSLVIPIPKSPAGRSLTHPALAPLRTLTRRKPRGSGSARICLGHVERWTWTGAVESQKARMSLRPDLARAVAGCASEKLIRRHPAASQRERAGLRWGRRAVRPRQPWAE